MNRTQGRRRSGPDASSGAVAPARRRTVLGRVLGTGLAVVLVAALTIVVVRHLQPRRAAPVSELRPSGLPSDVSTPLANLMGLSPVPGRLAPGFVLTDQKGRTVALSSLRGRAVVLEFMDPHCIDICPLVSQEFVDAYHDLGSSAGKVAFVSVNVNQYYATVRDMMAYSQAHQLVTIPSWHFLTGATGRLHEVWNAYGVLVQAPNPNADIVHTSVLYFIDAHGVERYAADPMVDHTASGATYLPADQLVSWGHGIALIAKRLAA